MVESAGRTLQSGLFKQTATAETDPESSTQYLAELAGIRPGSHVLDAGCGVGGPAITIARAFSDVVIEAVTISEIQARIARRLVAETGLAERVRVHLADFHRLPFRAALFDVAIYFESFCHSWDRVALFRESARVLRLGGKLYVKDLFRWEDPLTESQRSSMKAFDDVWAIPSSPTLSETEQAMRIAGFRGIKVREHPYIDLRHFYESMVLRDAGGIRLNDFGEAFMRFYPNLPAAFGDAKAIK
jgi:cyclopropane fatty-acyl-phospholipid synthase-like methyltransferase